MIARVRGLGSTAGRRSPTTEPATTTSARRATGVADWSTRRTLPPERHRRGPMAH